MSPFAYALALLVVVLALKPAFIRARQTVRTARMTVSELRRRKASISTQIRMLAKESLGQRLTSGKDRDESAEITIRIAGLQRRLTELERIDRRVLVMDERRGLSESGWITLVHRPAESAPPLEPDTVTKSWQDGRYFFFYAADATRAKRKAEIRFPTVEGYAVVEVLAHSGDLSDPPSISSGSSQQKESA